MFAYQNERQAFLPDVKFLNHHDRVLLIALGHDRRTKLRTLKSALFYLLYPGQTIADGNRLPQKLENGFQVFTRVLVIGD